MRMIILEGILHIVESAEAELKHPEWVRLACIQALKLIKKQYI